MATLYPPKLIWHITNPQNKKKLTGTCLKLGGQNLSCGDKLEFQIKLNAKKEIVAVGWQGDGCAISQASASILSEQILGKKIIDFKKITSSGYLKKFPIKLSPNRSKCYLLALMTIKGETN